MSFLAGPPIRSGLTKSTDVPAFSWVQWFQSITTLLNQILQGTTQLPTPGPYANDTAAATAGVGVGNAYYQASGVVVVRLS